MDEDEEQEYFFVNQRIISRYASREEHVRFLESVTDEYGAKNQDLCLEYGDEQFTLLFLQGWIRAQAKNSPGKHAGLLQFKNSFIDLRFFRLLRDNSSWNRVELQFEVTCQLKLRDKSEFEEIAKCLFFKAEKFTFGITQGCGRNYYRSVEASFNFFTNWQLVQQKAGCLRICIWRSKTITEEELIGDHQQQEDKLENKHAFPFFSTEKVQVSDAFNLISDFPLLTLALKCPNLVGVQLNYALTRNFGEQTVNEFCQRTSLNVLPCSFRCQTTFDYRAMIQILDHFNDLKLTNLELVLNGVSNECADDFLEKSLNVISQSVYLKELTVWTNNDPLMLRICEIFLEELSKKVTRMRQFSFNLHQSFRSTRIDELTKSIRLASERCSQGDYCGFLTLVSARVLSAERVGPNCFIQMLQLDLIRYLHTFLKWENYVPPENGFF